MKSWMGGLVIAGALALVAGYLVFAWGRGHISGEEAHRLVADEALLLDVRSPAEFEDGHIEGAVNVPVDELEGRLGDLAPHDRPIVVYCLSGNRSARAAQMLSQAGYSAVHDLGSISRW